MSYYIGIDLGGTKIAALALNLITEERSGQTTIPCEAKQGPDAVIQRMIDLTRQVCKNAGISLDQVSGIGVGVPGTVDLNKGCTLLIPNMPGNWVGRPVTPIMQEALERPAHIINDARAFTLAEASLGAGRGAHTVACFTLGTGIGGGIAIGGRLHLGVGASAGEFGHQTIRYNGLPDGSGAPGGLESFASGPAIAAMAAKAVMQGFTTEIATLVDYDLNRITPRVIMQAAEKGDVVALDILERAGEYLGAGVHNVVTILAPNRVILGGGVAHLGDWILKPVRATLERFCHAVPVDQVEIVFASLGDEAGAIGAALWAAQQT